jgi:hypothetical protein
VIRKSVFRNAAALCKAEENRVGHDMGNLVNLAPIADAVWTVRSRCRRCDRVLVFSSNRDGRVTSERTGGTAWGCRDVLPHEDRDWAMAALRSEAQAVGHSMYFPSPDVSIAGHVGVVSVCSLCLFTVRVIGTEYDIMVIRSEVGPVPPCRARTNGTGRQAETPAQAPARPPAADAAAVSARVIDL